MSAKLLELVSDCPRVPRGDALEVTIATATARRILARISSSRDTRISSSRDIR